MKRWLKMIANSVLIGVLGFVALLFLNQHKLIWFPRHYGAAYKLELPKTAAELRYTTSEGKQCAFYLPPHPVGAAATPMPERIWVCFCGNGSTALDWVDIIGPDPKRADGFLLIDYPGYGLCEGTAEPANIAESSDKALAELATHLQVQPSALEGRLNVLAHSIGCAAALEFAARHPVQRVILCAPFTTLRDMARRILGWPLCWLLRHNFDNRARLAELAARPAPPRVTIFHGEDDSLIPIQMGRSLAETFPKMIAFHAVPGGDHNSVVFLAQDGIFSAMNQ